MDRFRPFGWRKSPRSPVPLPTMISALLGGSWTSARGCTQLVLVLLLQTPDELAGKSSGLGRGHPCPILSPPPGKGMYSRGQRDEQCQGLQGPVAWLCPCPCPEHLLLCRGWSRDSWLCWCPHVECHRCGDGATPLVTATCGASSSLDPETHGPADATGEQKVLDVLEECWDTRDRAALLSSDTHLLSRGCSGQSLSAKLGAKGNHNSGLSWQGGCGLPAQCTVTWLPLKGGKPRFAALLC